MGTENERKFLVTGAGWRQGAGVAYAQGYLNRDPQRTVRVRIAGDRAFLTVKGASNGATRAEFEYEIPLEDASKLMELSDGPVVTKRRRVIEHAGSTWEVDEFEGENAGLVVAELELESENQAYAKPDWLGREVTDDPRYYNSSLAANPYHRWREDA
jgi:CYTH domain-containing protein